MVKKKKVIKMLRKRGYFETKVLFLTFLIYTSFAYVAVTQPWIDGTPLLYEEAQRLLEKVDYDGWVKTAPSAKLSLEQYKVGDDLRFYAMDLRNNRQYILDAKCYAFDDRIYIFAEKGLLISGNKANSVLSSAEKIFNRLTELFGPYPVGASGDPRIYILFMDIIDGAPANGVRLLGYFSPIDQFKNAQVFPATGKRSNEKNILYIDQMLLSLNQQLLESVIAHEFTHLLQWANDPKEALWVNEGIAVYAESFLGYNVSDRVSAFEKKSNISLTNWGNNVENYGMAYLIFAYIAEKFGGSMTIAKILKGQKQDIEGIESVLTNQGKILSFNELFSKWSIANYLDDPSIEGGYYGYTTLDVHALPSVVENVYPIDSKTFGIAPWSAFYVQLNKSSNEVLKIKISEESQDDLRSMILSYGASGKISIVSTDENKDLIDEFSLGKDINKATLVVSSQPKAIVDKNVQWSFSYSVQVLVPTFAVNPWLKDVISQWGKIKSNQD